jgi:hypothetical protein
MSDVPTWILNFFDSNNKIKLNRILNEEYSPDFHKVLTSLVQPALHGDLPLFLPMSSDRLWFYAIAENIRELMELKRVLKSHLGSVYIYPNLPVINTAGNDAEKSLIDKFPFGFIKFTLLDSLKDNNQAKIKVFEILAKILSLYKLKPVLTTFAQRPIGRVLRDFFTSCQVDDGKNSLKFLEEIKGAESFSQRNILFLELQALYACNKFNEVIEHKNLMDLLGGRVPQRITQILLRSIGNGELNKILEEDVFLPEGLDNVRENCKKISPLFDRKPNLESNLALLNDWKLWAIGSATVGSTSFQSCLPSFVDFAWIKRLCNWAEIEVERENIKPRSTSLDMPLDINEAISLLHRSLEATPDELTLIIGLLKSIPADLRGQLEKFQILDSLMNSLLVENEITQSGGWIEWFTKMSKPNAVFISLGQELHNSYLHWKSEDFNEGKILSCLQESSSDEVGAIFRDILPLLISWLSQRNIKCSVNFWITWLELLALDNVVSTQDISLSELIVNNILSQPYTKVEYLRVIEPLEILWEKGKSPAAFSAVIELMETLLESSCPDQNSRINLWQDIQSYSLLRWNRLDISERYLTRCIAGEILGDEACSAFPPNSPSEDSSDISGETPNLNGKLLGIYTLTEGAARRAKLVLENMFNGLVVEINHDHTATASLTNLAKKADYFVFAANSSKHQAYYPVSKIRNNLIYPQGKGASSIVNSFRSSVTEMSLLQ